VKTWEKQTRYDRDCSATDHNAPFNMLILNSFQKTTVEDESSFHKAEQAGLNLPVMDSLIAATAAAH